MPKTRNSKAYGGRSLYITRTERSEGEETESVICSNICTSVRVDIVIFYSKQTLKQTKTC